jgi:hypothetical protein
MSYTLACVIATGVSRTMELKQHLFLPAESGLDDTALAESEWIPDALAEL